MLGWGKARAESLRNPWVTHGWRGCLPCLQPLAMHFRFCCFHMHPPSILYASTVPSTGNQPCSFTVWSSKAVRTDSGAADFSQSRSRADDDAPAVHGSGRKSFQAVGRSTNPAALAGVHWPWFFGIPKILEAESGITIWLIWFYNKRDTDFCGGLID